MVNKKILLGLTTTPDSDWREKTREIDKFGIKEIALFTTAIGIENRKELYKLLENTKLESIPHLHLRDDMDLEEIKYLENKYDIRVFNVHGEKDPHPLLKSKDCLEKYRSKIYIENTDDIPNNEELEKFGGICIDFSHWQDGFLLGRREYNDKMKARIEKFPIGCSHISAVGKEMIRSNDVQLSEAKYKNFSKHHFDALEEFDYIRDFIDYLPDLISLELTNSFEEQLEAKKYLEEIINR